MERFGIIDDGTATVVPEFRETAYQEVLRVCFDMFFRLVDRNNKKR